MPFDSTPWRRLFIPVATALLAGCATYHPLPLASGRSLEQVADITVPAASMPTPALRAYHFDAADGLDVTEVAMLAVANSPQLRFERDAASVVHAQAYAAGLLPDPQLSYSHEHPTGNQSGTTDSFGEGITLDLGSLVTRSARVAAARTAARDVDLKLLWSEWQAIAQARTLFDRVHFLRAQVARLQREHAALARIQIAITRALRAGDVTHEMAAAGLNAAADANNQLGDAERQLHQASHDLHDLLGLDATVRLRLTGAPFSMWTQSSPSLRTSSGLSQLPSPAR